MKFKKKIISVISDYIWTIGQSLKEIIMSALILESEYLGRKNPNLQLHKQQFSKHFLNIA